MVDKANKQTLSTPESPFHDARMQTALAVQSLPHPKAEPLGELITNKFAAIIKRVADPNNNYNPREADARRDSPALQAFRACAFG